MRTLAKIPVLVEEPSDLPHANARESLRESLREPLPDSKKVSHVRALTLTRVTQIVVLILGVIAFAYFARALVLPVMMAWVASMALKPPVTWLRCRHVPTPVAAGLVVSVLGIAIVCGMFYLGRPAATWIQSGPQSIPQLKQKFQGLMHPFAGLNLMAANVTSASTNLVSPKSALPVPDTTNNHIISTVFNWTGTALAGIVETVALLFLLLASGDRFTQKIVHVMPTLRDKKRAVELSHEIQQSISRYLFSVGLINLCLGLLVGTFFYLLGMPSPVMWGAVAAMANFIPYFGPIIGMLAVAVAGLLAFDTLGAGLAPAGAYLAVHLIEANLVTPYALGRRFTLNPVIIFAFLIFCVWLWGVIGAFLAVPILVTLKVICDRVKNLSPLAEFLAN